MKASWKRRLLLFLSMAVAVLPIPAQGVSAESGWDFENRSLDEVIGEYMTEHGLQESNFSMGWYELSSGDSWFYNEDAYMDAGSMYKLPLNMVYTDMLARGEIADTDIVGNYKVSVAMEASIVYSDNDAAKALRTGLPSDQREYRDLLAQYSGIEPEDLPEEYYYQNRISPRFLINTLKYLYDNSAQYDQLIGYMKQAHPDRYFKKSEGDYAIAHKYGYYEGFLNDCAIVYTPRPFLLVVFTKNVPNGETVLSELCQMMKEYALYLEETAQAEALETQRVEEEARQTVPEQEAAPDAQPAVENAAPVGTGETAAESGSRGIYLAVIAGTGAGVLLLGRYLRQKKRGETAQR